MKPPRLPVGVSTPSSVCCQRPGGAHSLRRCCLPSPPLSRTTASLCRRRPRSFLFSTSCISSVRSYCTFVLDELYCFPSLSPLVSLSYLSLSCVCCPGNRYPSQSHASLPIGIFFSGLGPLPLDSAHLHPQTAGPLLCGWGSSCAHARKVSRCEHECLRGPTFGVPRGHSLRNHLEADRWRHGGAGLMLHDPIFMRSRKPGFLHVKSPDC